MKQTNLVDNKILKAELHSRRRTTSKALQTKKLHTQMTLNEKVEILKQVHQLNIETLKVSSHLREKDAITFDIEDIKNTISTCNTKAIIEFNVTKMGNENDLRVLLKSNKVTLTECKGKTVKCNLLFVVSLKNNRVVTAFYNRVNDTHKNLDMNYYTNSIDILNLLNSNINC